jgi:hypothetical protein
VQEEPWVPLCVLPGERLHDTVNLLGLTRKGNVHEEAAEGNVERDARKVKLRHIVPESREVKVISAVARKDTGF